MQDLLNIDSAARAAFAECALTSCAAVVQFFTAGRSVQAGVHVKPAALPLADGLTMDVFYKQTRYAPASWRFFRRRSKARREFDNYAAFAQLGVPCAERLATGEVRDGLGRLHRAFILTGAVPQARTLTEFVAQECPDCRAAASRALRRSLLRRLAALTRRAHDGGFFHNDLYWRNILVTWDRSAEPKIWWIDCPRGGFARFRRAPRALKDLAALDKMAACVCSRAERLAFVQEYLGKLALDAEVLCHARAVQTFRLTRWPEDDVG